MTNLTQEPLRGCELSFRFDGAASSFLVEPYAVALPEIPVGGSTILESPGE